MKAMTCTFILGPKGFDREASLPLTDRGFRYGMSIFETIAIRDSRPILADEHLEKLTGISDHVNFAPPAGWLEATRAMLADTPIVEGVCRVYLTGGDGGMELTVRESRVALIFEETPIPAPEKVAATTAISTPFIPMLPPGKTGNYWGHLIANAQSGDQQTILFTPDGTLLGGATSNLFLVKAGRIVTPALNGEIRRGAVHDWVVSEFPVSRETLTLQDIDEAGDAFLTNSRMGVQRLSKLDDRALPGHPLVEEIWQRYRSQVLQIPSS